MGLKRITIHTDIHTYGQFSSLMKNRLCRDTWTITGMSVMQHMNSPRSPPNLLFASASQLRDLWL